jgi:carotenoid 1,2-hydratase
VAPDLRIPALPDAPGGYRWLYADAQCGPWTAVCIVMVGALFSPRWVVAAARGASPRAHCAVNCALHRDGRRMAWAFTEHPGATVDDDGCVLRVGRSRFAYEADGGVRLVIDERTAPWGRPLQLALRLAPTAPPAAELPLDPARRHGWEARMPRATATLALPDGTTAAGVGYHDTNHGDEPLGLGLRGWTWSRVAGRDATVVRYCPPGATELEVVAGDAGTRVRAVPATPDPVRRSRWGLALPDAIRAGGATVPVDAVLESSPFYARLAGTADGRLAVAEVADFARFRQPWIRWMAHFRMRLERT